MNILLLGAPGAGKGTQAKLLEKRLGLKHIAPGDILRDEVKNETELGIKAKSYMDGGNLVPDSLIIDMMIKRIDKENGVILDGFPRNIAQAEALTEYFRDSGKTLDHVIKISVSEDEIIRRLSGRRVCPECGATYNIMFNPPQKEGICDVDGTALIHRKDDTEETIHKRFSVFDEQTRPIIDYYQQHGGVEIVHGERDVEDIFNGILQYIEEN